MLDCKIHISSLMFVSTNPFTGELLFEREFLDAESLDRHLKRAGDAFSAWSALPVAERAREVALLAPALEAQRDELAGIITREIGKPLDQARAELEKCASLCRYYAEQAEQFLTPQKRFFEDKQAIVRFDPLGAVFAIMPWNYPFWQVFRFGIPSLLAGNAALLKPAPNVGQCGLAIEELLGRHLSVPGLFQILFVDTDQVEQIIASPVVQGVTLTGSDRAGSAVAALAGKHLKKCVLELGGSDPYLVLADADLDKVAGVGLQARLNNNGQTCIAAKRFIVQAEVYEPFKTRLLDRLNQLEEGAPEDGDVLLTTMARRDLRDELKKQVDGSLEQGARIAWKMPLPHNGPPYRMGPLVLEGARPGMPAYDEELFGPVFTLLRAPDEEEAIRLANDTPYGLGASIWTQDESKALKIAARLQAKAIAINDMVKSDPRLPFGGVKRSGFGRELGREGLLEFTNLKTIVLG
jgi:succinate-semialdehyde dehydrogenase/glutarate-semialdehyde dehydrogenase